jgi:two-component system chemotaxis response regulator CheY
MENKMNILIVDDNMTNRMMLLALLENFASENHLSFELDEAGDGQEAVNKCNEKEYAMVLMDINMPNMNGIEASRIIREMHTKIMIIAVSTSDDIEQRRAILNNGAEDYISKPIDADVFKTRMKNYMHLLEARQNKMAVSSRFINLYSNEIYSRHTSFILDSEDSLAEFWEFFLLKARAKSNYLSDIVRAVVSIVERQLKIAPTNKLYIEESEDKQYFTLTNIDVLPEKVIQLILAKNEIKEGYKLSPSKISFELFKAKQYEDEDLKSVAIENNTTQESKELKIIETNNEVSFASSQALEVFDYMDPDDLMDLEEYVKKLSSIMLIVGYGDVTEDEVMDIYTNLDRVSSILSSYSEVYPISVALSQLSEDMSSHVEEFTQNSEALGPMCKAFSTDLSNWVEQSFHTGAPSADFMNDTIVVNCQTIGGMLKMDEAAPAGDDDFDDIFDF